MRFLRSSAFAFGLAASANFADAQAQFLVSDQSFGHTGRINERGEPKIPGFSVRGSPYDPEVLSNKVILTQPAPGSTNGALWAENPNPYLTWVTDVDFRVNGPERGVGNINIWLARDGPSKVDQSTIYTVGQFDGLALVIDQHGGSGGMVRGFLNDGTTDYRGTRNIDGLAFGHCQYSYRNLGRASQIKLRQSETVFRVEIDGKLCFESDKIGMPPGYYLGVTSASGDNPDSTEIFKLVTMTGDLNDKRQVPPPQQQVQTNLGSRRPPGNTNGRVTNDGGPQMGTMDGTMDDEEEGMADMDASLYTSSEQQFTDLHNRIQSVTHQVARAARQVTSGNNLNDQRHRENKKAFEEIQNAIAKLGDVSGLSQMQADLTKLQNEVRSIKGDVRNRVQESERNIKNYISNNHGTMLEHVAVQAAPRHGILIFVIVCTQVVVVAGYIYYERKKVMPKKYL